MGALRQPAVQHRGPAGAPRLLETVPAIARFVVMVQREVGERLAARPGDDGYGAVSVHVAYRAVATIVRRVPPTVFWPRPAVDSVVLRLERRSPRVAVEDVAGFGGSSWTRASPSAARPCATRCVGWACPCPGRTTFLPRPAWNRPHEPRSCPSPTFAPRSPLRPERGAHPQRGRASTRPGDRSQGPREAQRVPPGARPPRRRLPRPREPGAAAVACTTSSPSARRRPQAGRPLRAEASARRAPAGPERTWRSPRRPALCDAASWRRGRRDRDRQADPGGGRAGRRQRGRRGDVLIALNELWGCGLGSDPELASIGSRIGSDVPALLAGGPVLASGRGDARHARPRAATWWVLKPFDFGVLAADAYGWWDDAGAATGPDPGALIAAAETGNDELLGDALFNDLQAPVTARHPQILEAIEAFQRAGALGAVMTGSGPTVVALDRELRTPPAGVSVPAVHGRRTAGSPGRAAGIIAAVRGRLTARHGPLEPGMEVRPLPPERAASASVDGRSELQDDGPSPLDPGCELAETKRQSLALVVLAAGKGKRLKSSTPKVLASDLRPAGAVARPEGRERGEADEDRRRGRPRRRRRRVRGAIVGTFAPSPCSSSRPSSSAPGTPSSRPNEPSGRVDDVLVANGDFDPVSPEDVRRPVRRHRRTAAAATIASRPSWTTPGGYGRVVRDGAPARRRRRGTPRRPPTARSTRWRRTGSRSAATTCSRRCRSSAGTTASASTT